MSMVFFIPSLNNYSTLIDHEYLHSCNYQNISEFLITHGYKLYISIKKDIQLKDNTKMYNVLLSDNLD